MLKSCILHQGLVESRYLSGGYHQLHINQPLVLCKSFKELFLKRHITDVKLSKCLIQRQGLAEPSKRLEAVATQSKSA